MKAIVFLITLFILSSCASDYYVLNKFRNVLLPSVVGYRAGNPLSVDLIADDALRIEENSKTSLRKFGVTQYEKSFILTKVSGTNFELIERTSPLEKDTTQGLKLNFSENGLKIYENGNLVKSDANILLDNNFEYLFKILQDGDYSTFVVDCDTLIKHKCKNPATEYTIFRTGATTELEIYSFDVEEIYENYEFW